MTRSHARPASTQHALAVRRLGRTTVKVGQRWGTTSKPAKMGMCKKAGIVGESVVNGPVTRSLRMLCLSALRTTLRMDMSSLAICVLPPAATAGLEAGFCVRKTQHGIRAQCGVLSFEFLFPTFY